jgi:hypothetical protein
MPAVGVRVLAAFLLGACLFSCTSGGCTLIGVEPCCTTVEFDLRQVLATVPGDVEILTCVDGKCVGQVGPSSRWAVFEVQYDEELDDPQAEVRVIVRDNAGVVFDATRQLRLRSSWFNGPGCPPLVSDGRVQATPEGDLIQLIPT